MPATLLHIHDPIMITLSKGQGLGCPTPGSHTSGTGNLNMRLGLYFTKHKYIPKFSKDNFSFPNLNFAYDLMTLSLIYESPQPR